MCTQKRNPQQRNPQKIYSAKEVCMIVGMMAMMISCSNVLSVNSPRWSSWHIVVTKLRDCQSNIASWCTTDESTNPACIPFWEAGWWAPSSLNHPSIVIVRYDTCLPCGIAFSTLHYLRSTMYVEHAILPTHSHILNATKLIECARDRVVTLTGWGLA